MKTTFLIGFVAATALLAAPSYAQHDHQHAGTTPPASAKASPAGGMDARGMMHSKMMEHCQMMMQMHDKMATDMKVQDARLKVMTDAMDKASGEEKVTAMAAVIKEMIVQREARQRMMSDMQSKMMSHMMEHMQNGGKAGMTQCPMMKGMSAGMKMEKKAQ